MRFGLTLSLLAHGALVAASFAALPEEWRPDVSPPVIVPVELAVIGEETNIPQVEPEPEPEPELEPEPEPEPEPAPEPVEEEPEFAPELTAPTAAPEPDGAPPLPEPEAAPAPEAEPKSKPLPQAKASALRPRVKPRKDEQLDFGRLSALIDRAEEDAPARAKPSEAPEAQADEKKPKGLGAEYQLTLSEEDALRARMYQCWSLPGLGGGANFEDKVVSIRVRLARDGAIAEPPQLLEEGRIMRSNDPFLQAAAESAVRAVLKCAPYDFLPTEKYDSWKEIVMRFDPSDMLGR